jgi:hypothetical protein
MRNYGTKQYRAGSWVDSLLLCNSGQKPYLVTNHGANERNFACKARPVDYKLPVLSGTESRVMHH